MFLPFVAPHEASHFPLLCQQKMPFCAPDQIQKQILRSSFHFAKFAGRLVAHAPGIRAIPLIVQTLTSVHAFPVQVPTK